MPSKDIPMDLFNRKLKNEDEFTITYRGPSFDNRMEMQTLRKQLKAVNYFIKDTIDELYKEKEIHINSKEIKIFLKVKKGSFEELLLLVFNHPIATAIISTVIIDYFKSLSKNKKSTNKIVNNMTNNFFFLKNTNQIINPLSTSGDKVIIKTSQNENNNVEIKYEEKEIVNQHLKEIEKKSKFETYEEEFFGYLSRVDIDTVKFGFTLEGPNKHIPVSFESHLNIDDIRQILGKRVLIRARSHYKFKELYKLEILDYTLKIKKKLDDY